MNGDRLKADRRVPLPSDGRVLLEGAAELGYTVQAANQGRRDLIMAETTQVEGCVLSEELTDALQGLWEDPGIQKAYGRRNELQINDSAA